MIFRLWETLADYFKEKPYWSKIRPLFTLLSLYLIAVVLQYQYIRWEYRVSPALSLYLRSYMFKQLTLIFVGIGLVAAILAWRGTQARREENRWSRLAHVFTPRVLQKALGIALVFAVLIPVFLYVSPGTVSHIRVKFLAEPDFDQYALVYLIYELNRLQKNWYFEIDFDVFNQAVLSSKERRRCDGEYQSLCLAELLANGRPLIAITTEQLGADFFFQNRGQVSVVSTFQWDRYAPPSVYEYLIHSLIVQSILIHLNAYGPGLPADAFQESRVAFGDLFQFSPQRREMKAAILASHLTPKGEEVLLNSFGVEYMTTCLNLLTLEWLRSERVKDNLEKSFGVSF